MIQLKQSALIQEIQAQVARRIQSKASVIRQTLESDRAIKIRTTNAEEIKAYRSTAYASASRRGKVATRLFEDSTDTPDRKVYTLYIYPASWKRSDPVLLTRRDSITQ